MGMSRRGEVRASADVRGRIFGVEPAFLIFFFSSPGI